MKGAIILSEGREYRNMMIRLNLLESQVNYIDSTNTEIIATTPIKEVVLWDTLTNTDFRFVNSDYIKTKQIAEHDFYELLIAGKTELYKQHKKLMSETRPYGSATYEQTIQTHTLFYILKDGEWKRIKKLSELKAVFADKANDINQYCAKYRITKDNEESFKYLTLYYNSLFLQ